MDRRLALTVVAVLAVAVGFGALISLPDPEDAAPLSENIAGVELAPENSAEAEQAASEAEADEVYAYVIREHEGRVAVFSAADDVKPEMVLSLVKYLPDYDRIQLRQGIRVRDYRELVSLLEDYVS